LNSLLAQLQRTTVAVFGMDNFTGTNTDGQRG
jgi:hypothetical protein